ncbi:hypothetical protein [Streptomyces sp. NBC_01235]|uniref:hypothetical protein n=1 Tax=Streptomyces sp. NBC_01235 TaxID=2903788 RepID=UPI002E15ADE3|nr:hypothetical protein OG289_22850 [Streptomyces sp. NBC_01235]
MDRRGQKFRFTAVSVFVVLALTGFSTGRGHGHGSSHSGGGGGGGCSSSGQDHDSSSSSGGTSGSRYHDYDDDDDYTDDTDDTYGGSGSSDASTTLQDASVKLIDCATPTQAYATVEVTNPNATGAYFTVTVDFLDAGSDRVEEQSTDKYVAGNETTTVQVDLSSPGVAAKVDHCNPQPYASAG